MDLDLNIEKLLIINKGTEFVLNVKKNSLLDVILMIIMLKLLLNVKLEQQVTILTTMMK